MNVWKSRVIILQLVKMLEADMNVFAFMDTSNTTNYVKVKVFILLSLKKLESYRGPGILTTYFGLGGYAPLIQLLKRK